MPVSLAQYRGEIGLFYNRSFAPNLSYMILFIFIYGLYLQLVQHDTLGKYNEYFPDFLILV